MTDVNSTEQEVKPAPSLKEVFLQTTFAPGRAIPDSVRTIELGVFAEEARELIRLTLTDPRKREYGKRVTIQSDTKKMRIYKTETGTEGSVEHAQPIRYYTHASPAQPRYQRMAEMWVTGIHSHPTDISPGSGDLMAILLGDHDPRGETAVFVVTESRFFLVFRGSKTPHFTYEQAQAKRDMWEKAMKERVEQFRTPNMPVAEQVKINDRARTQLLRQISAKYDLKVFSGDLNKGTVQLQF